MLKDNNLNSSSEEYEFIEKAIISNKGIWRCIENEAKDDNVIELPFYNNGDLEIHGTSHTEFKYLHQEKGSINLLDGGSIGSNTSIHLNYGSILGNGTIHGNINSSNGEIGHLFELNDLLINGNLQADQTILIHSAAGGVDLSSLELLKCKQHKGYIFLTVGSKDKEEYLIDKYGSFITGIYSSRNKNYVHQIKSKLKQLECDKDHQGVDLILNTHLEEL
ncbi:hypothetical protein DICPUDRAFT_83502 [Dictyostelium purpureum]|uniref:Uncharacterized protein n=1 Tax=Dictyostelium purpureum TaxID=5786 RepID=F0ZZQ2_DICPU|nr:uncharacterized protein DICPUDRAFT_83502 [Dictyostelium purpureum]EGC30573.1 hypothetical protein DICPUDRAFT_83502 [Dictyostelium purpureum]|eukprot:XP_003292895.1 hypothetical protein DICPUDRAFT_83502 [Dictyostelium purpureum]